MIIIGKCQLPLDINLLASILQIYQPFPYHWHDVIPSLHKIGFSSFSRNMDLGLALGFYPQPYGILIKSSRLLGFTNPKIPILSKPLSYASFLSKIQLPKIIRHLYICDELHYSFCKVAYLN